MKAKKIIIIIVVILLIALLGFAGFSIYKYVIYRIMSTTKAPLPHKGQGTLFLRSQKYGNKLTKATNFT